MGGVKKIKPFRWNIKSRVLRTQEISVALHINPHNVGGEIRKTFIIKYAN